MWRRSLSIWSVLLACVIVLAWAEPPAAAGGQPFLFLRQRPWEPRFYPEYNIGWGWQGYDVGVPSYRWGYFGARPRSSYVRHRGYYGDYLQWSCRRGY